MIDWVDWLVATACVGTSYAIGVWQGHRVKGQLKEICQCKHVSSMHNKTGCQGTVTIDRLSCPCVHYVGPHSSYIPEVDG